MPIPGITDLAGISVNILIFLPWRSVTQWMRFLQIPTRFSQALSFIQTVVNTEN